MNTFAARYVGPCAADCGVWIKPGDDVTYVDDELMHADCADGDSSAQAAVRQPDPCPRCWTVHRGECL